PRRAPVGRPAAPARRPAARTAGRRLRGADLDPGDLGPEGAGCAVHVPRIDREMYRIDTDEQFAYDLLRARKLLVTQGTGFNLGTHDHFRLVTLPSVEVLTDALDRIGDYLGTIRR